MASFVLGNQSSVDQSTLNIALSLPVLKQNYKFYSVRTLNM